MYTYYWYLIKTSESQFTEISGDWILVCPDFPDIYISDVGLDTKTYRNTQFTDQAHRLVEDKMHAMFVCGDTIPAGQARMPDYFYFSICMADKENSSPYNSI